MEILAYEDAIEKPLIINFIVFRNWFPSVTQPKLLKILSYFQSKSRIKWKLIYDDIEIFCFKLSTISSDYAAKVRRDFEQTSDSLRKKSVTEVDKEIDLKKKKKNKKEIKKELGEFDKALLGFAEMRKNIKKPLTERAKKMLLTELGKLSNDEATQIKILNQSEFHCWQKVYALKDDKPFNRYSQKLDTKELYEHNKELKLE